MKTLALCLAAATAVLSAPAHASPARPQGTPQGAQAQDPYGALQQELERATAAWKEKVAAARKAGAQEELVQLYSAEQYPDSVFVPRFLALAEKHPKNSVALRSLTFAVVHGSDEQQIAALAVLERDFIGSASLAEVCPEVRSLDPRAQAFLLRVMSENTHREVKGEACYALARLCQRKAERAESSGADAREVAKRAEDLLNEVTKTYADVPPRGATLGTAAQGDLFELRELALGKVAPDIAGEDVDGAALKLSDFRGQVVVLAFWTTSMDQRRFDPVAALHSMAGKPCALVGVNGDSDRAALKETLKAQGGAAWRSFWDGGGTSGPIATRWNVSAWPTVYVLDGEGRIRFKNPQPAELERALDTLIKELPARPPAKK
jgi:hypothetical protein